ncbi:MAG: hypothetical protein QOK31_1624 [Solirubrobacteraceae bacterium]|jgi:hypothetical protein|nr:hypothetical protein [Solirubrobacteraceae bacterium]
MVFGSGPQTAYTGNGWVLEAVTATSLRLRNTSGNFMSWGLTYPQSCGTQPVPIGSSFRFSVTTGDTLSGSLCSEGSVLTAYVTENTGAAMTTVVCQLVSSNAPACKREP